MRMRLILIITAMISIGPATPIEAAIKQEQTVARANTDVAVQLEQKVTTTAAKIRCLVCPGQAVAESNTAFSSNIRNYIRQSFQQGKSEHEIIVQLQQQYGDDIALTPKLKSSTWLLWSTPVLLLLGIVLKCIWQFQGRKKTMQKIGL